VNTSALPPAFVARIRAQLGTEADKLFDALAQPATTGLRVNTLKLTPEAFRALVPWALEPVPWCRSGFIVPEAVQPGKHPLHAAGLYYLQEPSAMAVAEALTPEAGDWVIDLAAAPGGKSTHLASLLGASGLLVSNEVHRARVRALGENLERWGARNALIASSEIARLADAWGASFDRVLLDAPCSGEGMFRKSESALAMWSPATVEHCATRQSALLEAAARLVKPGGTLVYSTCTFAPEENEQVVAEFLTAHPGFVLKPIVLPGASPGRPEWVAGAPPSHELAKAARFWPHLAPGEGHFVAALERRDGERAPRTLEPTPPLPRSARALWDAFVVQTLKRDPVEGSPLSLRGENLYALPEHLPVLGGLTVLRAGLWLGKLKRGRFEPSHALALALRGDEVQRMLELSPTDARVLRYLQGDVLEAAGEDGWLLVTVAGFALGWGKRKGGVVKNAYPKGLRWY
jgi:NOL1/NOP2/sun family putative RNA methylase